MEKHALCKLITKPLYRSSRSQMFSEIDVLTKYLQESTCAGVFFLIKLQATLLKRDCKTGVFLWILQNSQQNTSGSCFCTLGTTVLENIVEETERNIVTINFLIITWDLQVKQIIFYEDLNIHTYSLFCLFVLAAENSRKPLLLVTYRNQFFLYFNF